MSGPMRSEGVYAVMDPADMARFRFILESCGHLAYFTVKDKYGAVVRLVFAPGWREEVLAVLESMSGDIPLQVIEPPRGNTGG